MNFFTHCIIKSGSDFFNFQYNFSGFRTLYFDRQIKLISNEQHSQYSPANTSTSKTVHPYSIVDAAIAVIAASGLKYRVTPFETVMEGSYDHYGSGKTRSTSLLRRQLPKSLMTPQNQSNGNGDVSIEDKMGKYE